jgi:hypothetical protein
MTTSTQTQTNTTTTANPLPAPPALGTSQNIIRAFHTTSEGMAGAEAVEEAAEEEEEWANQEQPKSL